MHLFDKLSIKNKLNILIIFTSGSVLLLASIAFITSDLLDVRQRMTQELFILAGLVAEHNKPSLLFKDAENSQKNLAVLNQAPRIAVAHVFAEDGVLFSSYARDKAFLDKLTAPQRQVAWYYSRHSPNNPDTFGKASWRFTDTTLEVLKPIYHHHKIIGTVYIQSDLTAFNQHLVAGIGIGTMVFLLSLLFAALLASRLQNILTLPILKLLYAMETVPRTGNYALRVNKTTDDEIGKLVDGFNHMLVQIEKHNKELETYRTHLEEMVVQRTAELAESRDHAEAANRAKSAFLANMSHELRTPLNGILGYAQILGLDKKMTPKQREGINIIKRSGDYLLTLINDILDLSKIEAGRIELTPNDFHFEDFIHSITDLFKIRAQQKNIAFICKVTAEGNLPTGIYTDEKRLRQIIINLLSNAIKFTEQGEVNLLIHYRHDGHTIFSVTDTGSGIAAEQQDLIFKPFQQASGGHQKAEGTGLGLSITQKLVEMMGGTIHVQSELGHGSEFSFNLFLPSARKPVIRTMPQHRMCISGYRTHTDAASYNILVVDDKEDNRMVLKDFLLPLGFKVIEADSGTMALELVQQMLPDLILLDLMMPNLDGYETSRRLRSDPTMANIPIIAISASVYAAHKERSQLAGCSDFLPKPVDTEALQTMIQKHLGLIWVYETNSHPPNQTRLLNEQSMQGPSPEIAQQLYQQALRGNLNAIVRRVNQLAQTQPQLTAFANQIEKLAEQFKERDIACLIKQYVE